MTKIIFLAVILVLGLANLDSGCSKLDGNNKCISCKDRYYLLNQICYHVSPFCFTFDIKGHCTSCYNSFYLDQGICISFKPVKYCSKYYQGKCQECQNGYQLIQNYCENDLLNEFQSSINVQDNQKECFQIDFGCALFDNILKNCRACELGYYLIQGKCILNHHSVDLNCIKTDLNNICIECYTGYWLKNGKCVLSNLLCRTYSTLNGRCTSCYEGYFFDENQGKCLI